MTKFRNRTKIFERTVLFFLYQELRKTSSNRQNLTQSSWKNHFNEHVENQQISNDFMFLVTWALPTLVILAFFVYQTKKYKNSKFGDSNFISIPSRWFALADTIDALFCLSGSMFTVGTLTQLLKIQVGRPRPDLFDRCWPGVLSQLPNRLPKSLKLPISADNLLCSENSSTMASAFKSFPSGHSSYSMAACVFLSLYIYRKFAAAGNEQKKTRVSDSLGLCLSLIPIFVSVHVGLTRITDHRHHPTDVVCGWALGGFVSFLFFRIYTAFEKCMITALPRPRQ